MHSKNHLCNLEPSERLCEESQLVTATNVYSFQLKSRGCWITFAHPSSRNWNQTHNNENNLLGPPESRFQGRGMHLLPATLPWNPGMQQDSQGDQRGTAWQLLAQEIILHNFSAGQKELNQLGKLYSFFSHELWQKAFKGQIPLHISKSFILC